MVVDFAYKQRARANQGYALRNIKLGLSRKLIYASGLVASFSCHLYFPDEHWQTLSTSGNPQLLIEHLRAILQKTPLGTLANLLIRYDSLLEPSRKLFDAYDRFIGMMTNEQPTTSGKSPREHLDTYGNRLCQLHVSEVNTASQHDPLSFAAVQAFAEVAELVPAWVPVILEARITQAQIVAEIEKAQRALPVVHEVIQ
jgi:hypothetical protein